MVHSFFAIAPDFHGTAEGPLACLALDLATGGCNPSVIQQSVGSTFLDAINAKGNQALVPTVSSTLYARSLGTGADTVGNLSSDRAFRLSLSLDSVRSLFILLLSVRSVAETFTVRTDDVIQPEVLIPPTSRLNGASVYSVQEICGIAYIQDHFVSLPTPRLCICRGLWIEYVALNAILSEPSISESLC